MSNEENLLFLGKNAKAKTKFADDVAPEKTARETAAAMKAMDVEGLVGGSSPTSSDASVQPRTLETLFSAPAARPKTAATPAKAMASRPAITTARPERPVTPPAAPAPSATTPKETPAPSAPKEPQRRGFFARLFGWLFRR